MSQTELISTRTCPFVQRSRIALAEKGVDFVFTEVNLKNKPDWFLRMSPRGKVPLLTVGDTVLFESQAICEYLDESMGGERLTPQDALERARDRAWFPFSGEDLFGSLFRAMVASDAETQQRAVEALRGHLTRLAQELPGNFLSGDGTRFGLADVAVAPTFTRVQLLESRFGLSWLPPIANLKDYGQRLLGLSAVAQSVPKGFEAALLAFLVKKGRAVVRQASSASS